MKILFVLLIILACYLIFTCLRIVPEANCYVIEFLGSYKTVWKNGLHLKIPVLERISKKVSMKEQVVDFPPQSVITKDNVTIDIDTVVYYKVFDPRLFTYGVTEPILALENLTATTLRNIIGEMELDNTLTSRDTINGKMQDILEEATNPWGIRVNRVELKNIIPPREIQNAMEKQMKAEREKRETLLQAEAHQESAILRARGDKEAKIMNAEAERDAAIAKAEGEAKSIELVYKAEAEGIERLKKAGVSAGVLELKRLETLKAVGDGRATKIILPTNLTDAASSACLTGEMLGLGEPIDKSAKEEPNVKIPDPCCEKPEIKKAVRPQRKPVEKGDPYVPNLR